MDSNKASNNKKNKKKAQSTIPKDKASKKVTDFSKSFKADFFTIRKVPISNAALERLAELMVEWALSSTSNIVFKEFLVLQRIQYKQLSDWMKRSEKLRRAKNFTLMVLGVNREKGALLKQIDGNMVKMTQHRYDPQWGESEERKAKLNAMSDKQLITKEDLNHLIRDILKPV